MRYQWMLLSSILLLSICPTWSFAQVTSGKGGGGKPGMSNSGGMPGGMSGSGSAPGRIKLKFPSGDSSYGGEGGEGYGGMAGGFGSGDIGQPITFEMDGKTYSVSRSINFQYVPHSFRPTKQIAGQASYGGMGSGPPGGGSPGGGYGGPPAMMGVGGRGSYGGDGMGMGKGGMGGASMGGGGGFSEAPLTDSGAGSVGDDPSFPPADILALVIDGELVNDRARIELVVQGQHGFELFKFQFHSSDNAAPQLPESGTKFTNVSESEIKLVSDIIRQTVWMEDALKLIRQSKGQGDVAASNEKLLKQLLAEQYDSQITRRELEAESIKKRLDALQEELKRRKLAKDRVVEVQWGRLILDAQGLLNKE